VGVAELSAGRVAWARNAEAMSRLGNDNDFYNLETLVLPDSQVHPFIHRLPGLSSVMAAMFGCSAMLWRCYGGVRRCYGGVRRWYGGVMAVFGEVMAVLWCHGGQVAGGLTELKLHISHGETI